MGIDHVLAAVNQSYWVEKGRSAIKTVLDRSVSVVFGRQMCEGSK